ncbi:MAG: DUF1549 domain-containing protein, partial [Opitutales bacterium]
LLVALLVVPLNADSSNELLLFFGRFHPVILHLPIGILFILFVVEIAQLIRPRLELGQSCGLMLWAGVLTSIPTVLAGFLLASSGDYDEELLSRHQWLGWATTLLFSWLLVLRYWVAAKPKAIWLYRPLLFANVVVLTLAGHYGGALTHGPNYLTRYMPAEMKTALGLGPKELPNTHVANTPGQGSDVVDFAHEIVPILRENCMECHGGDEAKGGFTINERDLMIGTGAIDFERPENSYMVYLMRTSDPEERMPPPKFREDPIPEEQIALIERWIAQGLPWEPGYSFSESRYEAQLKPRRPELPEGLDGANAIDLLIDDWFEEQKVERPLPLGDAAFLRRVYLDLIGLPPTPAELTAFLVDSSPDKRVKAIDTLLARNEDYADHWLSFWNDLLRNAYDGTGFITGGRKRITGWLYAALYNNLPYDEFVQQLVAPTEASRGFIDGIKWRGEVSASQTNAIQFSQNVSQVFLGINMKCASCHDSFTDQWKLADAYKLAAVYSPEPLELNRCDKPIGELAEAGWIYPELGEVNPELPRKERLEQLAKLIMHPENGRSARTIVNRLWQRLMGQGIVETVDMLDLEPWNGDLLDYLASYLLDVDYDLKRVIKLIVTSQTYQSQSVIAKKDSNDFRGPMMKRLTAEQFIDSVRQVSGSWPLPEEVMTDEIEKDTLKAVAHARGLKKWDGRHVRASLTMLDPFQAALGRPNRDQIVSGRPDLLSTLEAIHLANGPEFANMLEEAAAAILASEVPADEVVEQTYLAALSRPPSRQEQLLAEELIAHGTLQEGMADFLWTVFVKPEFFYIR